MILDLKTQIQILIKRLGKSTLNNKMFDSLPNKKNESMNKAGYDTACLDLKQMSLKYRNKMCMSDALSGKNSNLDQKNSITTKKESESNSHRKN